MGSWETFGKQDFPALYKNNKSKIQFQFIFRIKKVDGKTHDEKAKLKAYIVVMSIKNTIFTEHLWVTAFKLLFLQKAPS